MAKLMDYVYQDWAKICKQEILRYLPSRNDSLIAKNNGKENCLRVLDAFKGAHYLNLPLFMSVEGTYKRASEVFCFDPNEKIKEPVKVTRLLGVSKELFLAPEKVSVKNMVLLLSRMFAIVCFVVLCRIPALQMRPWNI
ncbi:MAG: hypothetical protein LUE61_04945 [Clostridiales bacterium]|nr:hypothetical protein [Clostridiales bacterium]